MNATRFFRYPCSGMACRLFLIFALVQSLPSMAADLQSGDLLVIGQNLDQGGIPQLVRYRNGVSELLAQSDTYIGRSVDFDSSGTLYVNGLFGFGVYSFDPATSTPVPVWEGGLAEVMAVGFDDKIYISSSKVVSRLDPATGSVTPLFSVHDVDIGDVNGITTDFDGNVYVSGEGISDGINSGQILKWTAATQQLALLVPTGCQNGGLCAVWDIATSRTGTLLASDFTDDQIIKINKDTGAVTASLPQVQRSGALAPGLGDNGYVVHVRSPFATMPRDAISFFDFVNGSLSGTIFSPFAIEDIVVFAPPVVDTDGDGITDDVDTDDDGDGMSDDFELNNDFDPLDPDDATEDADRDGATNREEFEGGSDPRDENSLPLPSEVAVVYRGTINSVDQYLSGGPFAVSQQISGGYTYEPNPTLNPDINAASTVGQYGLAASTAVSIGAASYATSSGFGMVLYGGDSPGIADGWDAGFSVAAPDIGDFTATGVTVSLRDFNSNVFPTDELPSTPPDLSEFESAAIVISYYDGSQKAYVRATLSLHQAARSAPGDFDGDGVVNTSDNCPLIAQSVHSDNDGDGYGDACDSDDDNDNLPDVEEAQWGTDPLVSDTDGDKLLDGVELARGRNPAVHEPAVLAPINFLLWMQ